MSSASHGSRSAWSSSKHGRIDHQPVGERVGDLAERRLDVPAPREEAVDLVGDAGDREDDRRGPGVAAVAAQDQHDEHREKHEPSDRQRVRKVPAPHADKDTAVRTAGDSRASSTPIATRSSALLRGRAGGGDFWAWRDEMIALAGSLTVAEIRREYVEVYRELRANGYTAVGEFHYLGLDEARAAAEAAAEAGVAFVCLYACYLRGGIPRFRQESVAELPARARGAPRRRDRRRRRPPLRPRLPGRRAP